MLNSLQFRTKEELVQMIESMRAALELIKREPEYAQEYAVDALEDFYDKWIR